MDKQWYRQPLQSKEFNDGLGQASDFSLTMAKVCFGIELKRGEKVKNKFEATEKEIERRKENG